MDFLLSLIPGGGLTAIIAAALAALAGAFGVYQAGKGAGRDKQLAKEAEARAKNLDRIRDAADAKPVGSVSDDQNNRDNR